MASNYYSDDSIEYLSNEENYSNGEDLDNDVYLSLNKNRKRKSITNTRRSLTKVAKLNDLNQNENKLKSNQERELLIIKDKTYLTFKIDRICEYAQILMHCLLYKINYYNKKIHFDKMLKYNIIVYKCKSEIVCEYISNCIESMRLLLYKMYNLDDNSKEDKKEKQKFFSIGLAVLKSSSNRYLASDANLLIKRYTLQIENLFAIENEENEKTDVKTANNEDSENITLSSLDEWYFRDSILKCLYSKDIHYPSDFKWQIQIRTHLNLMNNLNENEDLFKLFSWRQCDQEEIRSISSKSNSNSSINLISLIPVKTINYFDKLRIQLFIEQPTSNSRLNKFDEKLKLKYEKYKSKSSNKEMSINLNESFKSSN